MHLKFRNVNVAFRQLVDGIHNGHIMTKATKSRYGDVLRITEPIIITYTHPRERVLFNKARDCNCFFHLFESLWMLAGRNDLAPLVYYNSQMTKFSDDGVTVPDAYGYRWREYFGWDQLKYIIQELKKDNTSRRVVLQMWDSSLPDMETHASGMGDYDERPYMIGRDFHSAINGGKAVPCNLEALFDIVDGRLDMTVINRSNDTILGALGANVVHFSFLQEYLACCIGVEVGVYNQFSNNMHVYTNNFEPNKWLEDKYGDPRYAKNAEDQTVNGGLLLGPQLLSHPKPITQTIFDTEVKEFIDDPFKDWQCYFLNSVAKPMCQAFSHLKARHYDLAQEAMGRVIAEDWRIAGRNWLEKRERNWVNKKEEANVS